MVWDGCQRKTRRSLEDSIGSMTAAAEVFITYKSSWNAWVKKKYVLGSENKECAYIRFPQARTKQGVKNRSSLARRAPIGQPSQLLFHYLA